MANFGNVQNLPFAFFLPPLSAVVYAVLAYRRFDKLSDRRKSIQSSGHKKDIPFLKILVTCKISKRGCPSYTYKYAFPLSKNTVLFFSQSPGTEKSTRVRLRATERKVEGHRLLAATLLKEGLAELQSHLRIVYALLLEVLESILVQNLGPKVAIVAGTVTAVEDVVEVCGAVARDDLVDRSEERRVGKEC